MRARCGRFHLFLYESAVRPLNVAIIDSGASRYRTLLMMYPREFASKLISERGLRSIIWIGAIWIVQLDSVVTRASAVSVSPLAVCVLLTFRWQGGGGGVRLHNAALCWAFLRNVTSSTRQISEIDPPLPGKSCSESGCNQALIGVACQPGLSSIGQGRKKENRSGIARTYTCGNVVTAPVIRFA